MPSISTIHACVPTLPTPTTLRAISTNRNSVQQVSAIGLEGLAVGTQERDKALFNRVSLIPFEQLV